MALAYRKNNGQLMTKGPITTGILIYSLPLMAGNILQQLYNVTDTWIVGRFLGTDALAAVGSSFALMTFLTSVILGLCMGGGAAAAICYGAKDESGLRSTVALSFILILIVTAAVNTLTFLLLKPVFHLLHIPESVLPLMQEYMDIICAGMIAVFLFNFAASTLRAVGNSVIPVIFLALSSVVNIALDLLFVTVLHLGVGGAAWATVIAQYAGAAGLLLYIRIRAGWLIPRRNELRWNRELFERIRRLSLLTGVQQSIMNFGILLVQGIVNGFGAQVMAAFAAAVKIDAFAYMPVQDFGNGFSIFVGQNYGAGKQERIRTGVKSALGITILFCLFVSAFVCLRAVPLMEIFVDPRQKEIVAIGAQYLRIEGACYTGIGILFLLYGYFRAIDRPFVSIVLTVVSLGTRVLLAWRLSSILQIGVLGIWISVPIGWMLADLVGAAAYIRENKLQLQHQTRHKREEDTK